MLKRRPVYARDKNRAQGGLYGPTDSTYKAVKAISEEASIRHNSLKVKDAFTVKIETVPTVIRPLPDEVVTKGLASLYHQKNTGALDSEGFKELRAMLFEPLSGKTPPRSH